MTVTMVRSLTVHYTTVARHNGIADWLQFYSDVTIVRTPLHMAPPSSSSSVLIQALGPYTDTHNTHTHQKHEPYKIEDKR